MKKGLGRLVSLEMENEFGRLISLEVENRFQRLVSVIIEKGFRRLVSKSLQDSICKNKLLSYCLVLVQGLVFGNYGKVSEATHKHITQGQQRGRKLWQ